MDAGDLDPDPIAQFRTWYAEAATDAVCLATASSAGVPSARMVLVKQVSPAGFVFHTNRTSAKAHDLAANPQAALVFHWPPDRQVRVNGPVAVLPDEESDAYWASRPRGSQLSAWASHQSSVIAGRAVLEAQLDEVVRRFGAGQIPRPPHWGGYRLVPEAIEFWHHREDRLHDRIRYRRAGEKWERERLSP